MKAKKTISLIIVAILIVTISAILIGCSKEILITYDLGYENTKTTEIRKSSESFELFTPKREKRIFSHWRNENGDKIESPVSFKKDTTLYAVWGVEILYYVNNEEVHTGILIEGKTLEESADYKVEDESLVITGYYTTDENGDFLNDVTKAQIAEKTKVNVSLMTKGMVIEKVENESGEIANTVTKYTGESKNVIVPAVYNGEKVTALGNYLRQGSENASTITGAFEAVKDKNTGEYFPKVEKIELSNTLISIEKMALKNTIYLKEIYFPKNIERFGTGVMTNTTGESSALEKIEFAPDSKLKDTNFEAFGEHNKLRTVILPDGLEILGDSTFRGCTSLKKIDLKNVKVLRRAVFWACTGLKELHIPNSVTTIETAYRSGDSGFEPDYAKKSLIDGISNSSGIKITVNHNNAVIGFAGGWNCYNYQDNYDELTNIPVYFQARTIKYVTTIMGQEVESWLDKVHLPIGRYALPATPPSAHLLPDRNYAGMKVKGDENNVIIINSVGEYNLANIDLVSNTAIVFEIVYSEQSQLRS